jgi:methionyl-tRNA formyltransferase
MPSRLQALPERLGSTKAALRNLRPGRVVFIGTVHEAAPALLSLFQSDVEVACVFTMPATKAASVAGFVDLKPLAEPRGVPVVSVEDINASAVVERIRQLEPDLVVVAGWTRLLGAPLLSLAPRGCIGFHASLLPRHRGRAPVNWAILRGETLTGNTMFMLTPEADMGDIVDQRGIPIGDEDTCADIYAKVGCAGAEMLRTHLPALLAGTAPRRPQEFGDAEPLPKRTPAMGITLWDRPSRSVHDWIRALTLPYPGAFSLLRGHKVMLWRSALPGPHEPPGTPGCILTCDAHGMRVGTGDGSLVITWVSEAGKLPQPAQHWFAQAGLDRGAVFDPVDDVTAAWAMGATLAPAAVGR